ncbi:MAG: response regulator transcription factor [Caldilineaceae bacterium]
MSFRQRKAIPVILVDDHALVRRGLAALLQLEGEYQVVAEADNGENGLQVASQVHAELMILDLSMPRLNGLETIRRLKRQQPSCKILILSMYDDAEFVAKAIQNGVDGYLLKQSLEDELFEALEVIMEGGRYFSPKLDMVRIQEQTVPQEDFLTSREHEVLQLIAEGASANELANLLSISPHTANRHRANIMQKLGVHSQAELVRLAAERGWIILKKPVE